MTNPSKRKGTTFESTSVAYLREHHNPRTHRNVQMGSKDIGDIDGYFLHVLEAKAEKSITLSDYIRQANKEAMHAGKPFGCAWVKRRNAGIADAYVVRDAATDVRLMSRMRDMEEALQAMSFDRWHEIETVHNAACPWPVTSEE